MKKIGILFLLICFNSQSQNLTIQNGGSLTIEKSGSMNVSGNFSNSGTVTMHSDGDEFSAMKVSGSTSGTITYNRFVNVADLSGNEWDLIGSPVGGLSISNFVADNSGILATNGSQFAVGYYDNATNDWTNYTTATVASANDFDIGKGYQMGTVSGGTQILAFTGTISANDETQSVINNNAANSGNGRRWNLVANPYPTYLNANDDADNTNNFLTTNVSKIDSEFLAIYGWDADGTGYTARGHDFNSNAAVYLAPGQAFFIASDDVVGENITFSEAIQTVSPASSDDFIQGDAMSAKEIFLRIYHDDLFIEDTHIKFQDNMSLGLDPGYDLGSFDQNVAISSRLIEDDQGTNFSHQQLPLSSMQNAVIPIVVNQPAGQEFRINLHSATIPNPNVFLEDVQQGTFTNLYEDDVVISSDSDLVGVGRFYIHMSSETMSNEVGSRNLLNAYKRINDGHITIEGLSSQTANINVSLYNILGSKVLSTSFDNSLNERIISTQGISYGIYVIELESSGNRVAKKILIK